MNVKEEILKLKNQKRTYKEISDLLNVPLGTVKSTCYRNIKNEVVDKCQFCGSPLKHVEGKKKKKFCSDNCRHKYWRYHRDQLNKKANYHCVCEHCAKPFISYGNKKRKYCSRTCYLKARYGGHLHE